MPKLFRRSVHVVVDTLEVRGLDVAFTIEKSLKPEPNTCELRIWNLNESNRARLEELAIARVTVEAGYEADGPFSTSLLFHGDLRTAISERDGPDIITTIASGDGEQAYQKARVSISFAKGITFDVVLKMLAESMGLGLGNTTEILKKRLGALLFQAGTVLVGPAARELTSLTKAVGLTWSIQDGNLQFLDPALALKGSAVLLSSETGMIGSPTVDNKGHLSVQCLMIPDVVPGRLLVLDAERLKGNYKIEKCIYTGDTAGDDWFIGIEASRL